MIFLNLNWKKINQLEMIDHLELQRNILLSSTVDNRRHLQISYSETTFKHFYFGLK